MSLALSQPGSAADVLFHESFDTGFAGWTTTGDVSSEPLTTLVPNAIRLRIDATATRGIPTTGYTGVTISFFLAAGSLEATDRCHFEVSTDGVGWTTVRSLVDGEDDGSFRWDIASDSTYDDNSLLTVRLRAEADQPDDQCFFEDVTVKGIPAAGDGDCRAPVLGGYRDYLDDYAPLVGDGDVPRTELTFATLMTGPGPPSPIDYAAFALPVEAAPPLHQMNGRIALTGLDAIGEFSELVDWYAYTDVGDDPRKHLPPFDFELIQSGSHLIPTQRGIVTSSHPYWEYVLEPGRVWSETADGGMSRAALPFVLQQTNSNCVHNGVLTFLFDDSQISKVAYQIGAETCLYYQFDMWGLADGSYTSGAVGGPVRALKEEHQKYRAGRLPARSIDDLAIDYPGTDPSMFGNPSEVAPAAMTFYGLLIDGIHYTGGCNTRYGTYPFCDEMRAPSYSLAKTSFAATAAMRLERKYPGFRSEIVADWVPAAAADPEGDFADVTIEHALDMATGNYLFPGYIADEGSAAAFPFFDARYHAQKAYEAVRTWPRSATPGTAMHYHSSDTFLAIGVEDAFLRAREGSCRDVFRDVLVDEIWRPLGIGLGTRTTRRTYGPVAQPFGGYGLTFVRDDAARIGRFLGPDHGRVDGAQLLDGAWLAAGKFADPADRGLAATPGGLYNDSFWGINLSVFSGCADTWVPYLTGYGGNVIALFPNGAVYYFFSDGNTFEFRLAFREADSIRSSCNTSPPEPPLDLAVAGVTTTTARLVWSPPPIPIGVLRYRLFRDGAPVATTWGVDYTDTGLTPDTDYDYHVVAVDAVDNVSGASNLVTAHTLPIIIGCDLARVIATPPIDRTPPWLYTNSCDVVDVRIDDAIIVATSPPGGSIDLADSADPGPAGELTLYQLDCGCSERSFVVKSSPAGGIVRVSF